MSSAISAELIQAYRETEFRVAAPEPFTLSVGQASQALQSLYKLHKSDSAAYVTAWNPYSQETTADENDAAQARLEDELKRRSLGYVPGIGQHPSQQWPGEPSVLVLGLSLEAAKVLGKDYGQNAIVWCGPGAVPELILLR
jgi:hypothetical protein